MYTRSGNSNGSISVFFTDVRKALALLRFTQRIKIWLKYHKDTSSVLEFLKVFRFSSTTTTILYLPTLHLGVIKTR